MTAYALTASWRKSLGSVSQLAVDVVILHHGVGGNFYSPGMFEQYSDALLEQGCAVLRVNNRGHDPMSRAVVGEDVKRLGAAYEGMEDCRYDWAAWVTLPRRLAINGSGCGDTVWVPRSRSTIWPPNVTHGCSASSLAHRHGFPMRLTPLSMAQRSSTYGCPGATAY